MYRHLDDPSPPAPDEARYHAVVQLAKGIRTRRRRKAAAGTAVGLLALTGAVLVGVVAPAHAPSTTHQTAYQFNNQANPLPAGTPVPATTLTDVVFVGPRDGFALADHRNQLVLASTLDAGANWQVVDPQLPATLAAAGGGVEMEFVDADHGYLWRGPIPGTTRAPMWVTGDGGTTWSRAPIGPVVYDVSAIGPDVWALAGSCSTAAPCTLGLEISADAGATWHPASAPVPATVATGAASGIVSLARVDEDAAYVFSSMPTGGATIAYTTDAGTTWATRPVPCGGAFGAGGELALSSTDDLWLVCGGHATGGLQSKALYRSSTGGISWTLAAQTPAFAGAAPPPPGVGSLALQGYVAPYSIGHKTLAVLSASDAWLFPTGGQVSVTTDGGSTWSAVPSLERADFGLGGAGNVTFISGTDGWVVEFGVGLWHTVDGSTWTPAGD